MSKPTTRGNRCKKLYTCQECRTKQLLHWTETSRSARPRCVGCGSARLEISAMGKKEMAERNDAAADKLAAVVSRGTGSVAPQH